MSLMGAEQSIQAQRGTFGGTSDTYCSSSTCISPAATRERSYTFAGTPVRSGAVGAVEQPAFQQGARCSETGAAFSTSLKEERLPFLFRLFVGWVPKHYVEKDLSPLFSEFGVVKDIIVLKDKVTHAPRGCAFVSYATKEEAELAIQKLDRKLQLHGALSPLEVRFAKSHQYVQAGTGGDDNRQLFFTAAPMQLHEQELTQMFSQFGVVEEVNLFRDRKTGNSKGCGFITFQSRAQASAAMDSLENKNAEPSQEMSVQWADPELQFKKKRALEESNADNRMLFFAKVLRSAHEEDVKRLFARYGRVHDVNLFRAFQGAPTTKGCGLVTMGTHEEARAAIEGLDSRFSWDSMDAPMVVKWMDAALQRRRREQHLATMLQGLAPGSGANLSDPWLTQHSQLGGATSSSNLSLSRGASHVGGVAPALMLQPPADADVEEVPPVGCQPDTFKLFVGNLPKACTEEQLLPFFETIGKVAELVVVRDKSQLSKGSAFVWYVQRAHAERAILQFNLRHVLPDPTGEQDRPLVIRRARVRASKAVPAGTAAAAAAAAAATASTLSSLNSNMSSVMQAAAASGALGASSAAQMAALGLSQLSSNSQQQQHNATLAMLQDSAFYAASAVTRSNSNSMGMPNMQALIGLQGFDAQSLTLQQVHAAGGTSYMPLQQMMAGGYGTSSQHAPQAAQQQHAGGAQLMSIQAAPAVSDAGLYEAYGTPLTAPADRHVMERYMLAATNSTPSNPSSSLPTTSDFFNHHNHPSATTSSSLDAASLIGPLAVSVQLNLQQLGVVNSHMFSIQSMTAAQLNISPGPHGLFHLLVSGTKPQVEMARSLVMQVLGSSSSSSM